MKTYELIPLKDITEDARNIAVAWIKGYETMGFDIQQKHKLASDIMNYASEQVFAERERIIEKMKSRVRDDFDNSKVTTLQDLYDLIRDNL